MTPEDVLAQRWRPHTDCVIGFPSRKTYHARVHWVQGTGYFCCPDPRNCHCVEDGRPPMDKFCLPVVYYVNSTPVVGWWDLGINNMSALQIVNRTYPLTEHDVHVQVLDERFQRLHFGASVDAPRWHRIRETIENEAEEMMRHLPLWKGFVKPSYEPPPASRLTRIQLLFEP